MNKISTKLLSLLLVITMLIPSASMIVQAAESEISNNKSSIDLENIIEGQDGKVQVSTDDDGNLSLGFSGMDGKSSIEYNEKDAEYNPDDNLSYVGTMKGTGLGLYKAEGAVNVYQSDVDKNLSDADSFLKAVENSKPMTSADTKRFLTASSRVAEGDSANGVEENKTSKMRIVNESNAATGSIVVLDVDAVAILAMDADGTRIKDATVTIKYTDDNGNLRTRSVKTGSLGEAIFDNMEGTHFGALDIQHEKYRSKTALNVEFDGGEAVEKYLVPKEENDLYVRCADLDGLDMFEFAGEIPVSDADLFKQDLTYTVMVSKTGSRVLPETISICAENAGQTRTVKTLQKSKDEYSDENTATYVCKANWVSDSLFSEGDTICYNLESSTLLRAKNGPGASEKSGAKVVDAKTTTPLWTTAKYGFLDGVASYQLSENIPVIGGSTVGLDLFKFPISMVYLPDGSIYICGDKNLKKTSKAEDMVSNSWNPNKAELAKSMLKRMNNDLLSKISNFSNDIDTIAETGKGMVVDSSYNFSIDAIFTALGHYDKETKRLSLKLGAALCASGTYGMTWYYLMPIGPVVLPGYFGFETGVTGKAAGYMTISMDKDGQALDMLKSIKIDHDQEGQTGISFDLILSLSAYIGVGIRNVASAQATGSVYMDFGLDLAGAVPNVPDRSDPRLRITGGYKANVTATFMWFKFNKKLAGDNGWVYDSYGLYGKDNKDEASVKSASASSISEADYKKIDLEASQSTLTKVESNSSSEVEQYKLNGSNLLKASTGGQVVDAKTLNECSPRYILTKDYAVLFRMIPIEGRVRVVYQMMTFDGTLSKTVNVLPLPAPDKLSKQPNNDVTQYDVVAGDNNVISVCMIACNSDLTNVEKKAKSTYVVAEKIDLDKKDGVTYSVINDNATNYEMFADPVAIYRSDKISGGYATINKNGEHEYVDINGSSVSAGGDAFCVQNYQRVYEGANAVTPASISGPFINGGSLLRWMGFLNKEDERASDAQMNTIFDMEYKQIFGKAYTGSESPIKWAKSIGDKMYLAISGKLFYVDFKNPTVVGSYPAKIATYHILPVKDTNGELVSVVESDTFDVQNGLDGTLCITALSSNYDSDGVYQNSTLHVYRITETDDIPVVHGPQKIRMNIDEPSRFTAVVNSPTGSCIAFYTTPLAEQTTDSGVTDSAKLCQWTQPAYSQANVTAVSFEKSYISGTDTKIPLKVLCRNNGVNHLYSVELSLYLEGTLKYITKSFSVDLYPGDEVWLDLTDTPRPESWTTGAHSLGVRTNIEGSDFVSAVSSPKETKTDDMFMVKFDNSYLKMNINRKFVAGEERAYVAISNPSMVSVNAPVIQIVGQFKKKSADDNNTLRVIKNITLGVRKITDADIESNGEAQGVKYNSSFSLGEIWDKYSAGDDVLYGITVKLVPKSVANGTVTGAEAEALCNDMPESVYIENPNINNIVKIIATSNALIKGKIEGTGSYHFGDTVILKAVSNYGNKFVGWFDGEKLISEDAELTFNATENVNYEAKFVMDLKSVKLDNVTVKKGETIKLNPVIDALYGTKYTVEYTSSNEKLAVVDNDGNVKALRAGNVVITCKATDQYGNKVQDSCIVTVKQHWLLRLLDFIFIDIIHIDKIFKKK